MKKTSFAGLLLAIAGIAVAQVDPARVVATVNGVEIKGAEYYRRMEFLPGVGRNLGDGFAEFPPGFLTLEQLITEKLVFQLAKEKGVLPSDAEVQAELDTRIKQSPTFQVDWIASGRTQAELKYNIRFDLAQFRLLTAGITVTDQEVEQFYKQNAPMFTIPEQATLRVIVVRTQADADAVDKDLASGKAFAEIAKAKSADVTAKSGGEYGTVPISYLSEQVRTGVKAAKAGQTTAWFASADNTAKFKFLVEKITPATLQPLTAELRRQARRRLMMDKGKIRNHVKEDLNALRAKAAIDIKEAGFASAYKKFMDGYLKASGG